MIKNKAKDEVSYEQIEGYFNIIRPEDTVLENNFEGKIRLGDQPFLEQLNQGYNMETRKNAFYTKIINPKEMAYLENFKNQVQPEEIPAWWRTGDTLRYLYNSNFDLMTAIEVS